MEWIASMEAMCTLLSLSLSLGIKRIVAYIK
jgi:hypothetical protein